MALVQLTNALKLVIVEKVHVHSGTAAALATRPLHERGLGNHDRSIGTLNQKAVFLCKKLRLHPIGLRTLHCVSVDWGTMNDRSDR